MGQIYLVRHGQASFGKADYDQLSTLGEEQARLLGKWYAQRGQVFHRVVTGDMRRHHQTAAACMAQLDGAPAEREIDAGFNEYDHHDVLVKHRPDFADPEVVMHFLKTAPNPQRDFQNIFQAAMARWMDGAFDADYREPWPLFRSRVVMALKRLQASAAPSQDIIVFTSGGTIATLCQHVMDLTDQQVMALNWTLANAAVTRLFYQPDRLVLSYLNNFSHLEALGQGKVVTYR